MRNLVQLRISFVPKSINHLHGTWKARSWQSFMLPAISSVISDLIMQLL